MQIVDDFTIGDSNTKDTGAQTTNYIIVHFQYG